MREHVSLPCYEDIQFHDNDEYDTDEYDTNECEEALNPSGRRRCAAPFDPV